MVIATYAMAEEALDIKTLSALIMATPRTDVTQAVGRILRVKHERPLVVDIVDSHEIFQDNGRKDEHFTPKINIRLNKQLVSSIYNIIIGRVVQPQQPQQNRFGR